jgi:Zn-finger nucleic acid-binding protein
MVVLEHDRVELDYCPACAGIWLDAGELALLLGDAAPVAGFLDSGAPPPARERPRRCPECGRKMEKRVTAGPQPVCYDRCPAGQGIWFDHGELAHVLEHGSALTGAAPVVTWLRAMFPAGGNE